MNGFAASLKRFRTGAALSQRALALRAGLTPAYVSLLESDRRRPERPSVERLVAALRLNERDAALLIRAAGFSTPREESSGPAGGPGVLAGAEALLTSARLSDEQRRSLANLVQLYLDGLLARLREGRPLVTDLAAPWQTRALEAIDEQMAADFARFRDSQLRVSFDL